MQIKGILKYTLVIFLTATSCILISAQEIVPVQVSSNKVIIGGRVYLVHTVKPGQTLYGISRAYQVSEKDIAIENPGVYSGLQVGQVLKIPADAVRKESIDIQPDTGLFIVHVLKDGESYYSLSRMYNVSVSELEDANKGKVYTSLKEGEKILIPKTRSSARETEYILHKVRRRETVYSLTRQYGISEEELRQENPGLRWEGLRAGDVLRIPVKPNIGAESPEADIIANRKEDAGHRQVDTLSVVPLEQIVKMLPDYRGKELRLAYLIPFNYNTTDTLLQPDQDVVSSADQERVLTDPDKPASVAYLEFLEGSLLALDSLRDKGFRLDVKVYDVRRDSNRLSTVLEDPFIQEADLIIGPFHGPAIKQTSEFALQKGIPLIVPFFAEKGVIQSNPLLFQVNPSTEAELNGLAMALARESGHNMILIYHADSLSRLRASQLKERIFREQAAYTHPGNIVIKEIMVENIARLNLSGDFKQALTADKENVIILPEANEALVSTVVTQLYFQSREYRIRLYGLPQWTMFQNIDNTYLHKLEFSFVSNSYYDFNQPQIRHFLETYRGNFMAEPLSATRKGQMYAFTGFDLSYFFIDRIGRFGRDFPYYLNEGGVDNLLSDYHFRRVNNVGGFENTGLRIVRYNPDFSVSFQEITAGRD